MNKFFPIEKKMLIACKVKYILLSGNTTKKAIWIYFTTQQLENEQQIHAEASP